MENELFLEAQTKQYGSHMVMTNVHKPTKKKLVNIDTEFRDEYNTNDSSYYSVTLPEKFKYNITLPDRITSAKSIFVKSIEIPMTFFNVSTNLGNNSFTFTNNGNNVTTTVIVPDGNYTSMASIISATNSVLATASSSTLVFSTDSTGKYRLTAATNNYSINFASAGNTQTSNKYNFKNSLGWLLGFRKPTYDVNASAFITADFISQIAKPSPRYLYLALDEFNKSVQNSFVTSVANSFLNKNVIARISIDSYVYGNMLVANPHNGLLISDVRGYNGKIDLQKFNIQLLHENGTPVDLNSNEFSFCLEVTHE